MKTAKPIELGDYVLGTRWSDGDPDDPWAVGFYGGTHGEAHVIQHQDGTVIGRCYRRVERITAEQGSVILRLGNRRPCASVWAMRRHWRRLRRDILGEDA